MSDDPFDDSARARREARTYALLEQACATDDDARAASLREQAVLENRPMAVGLAMQFDGRGIERDDLTQVAMLGLVRAVHRYRPGAGPSFSAYAVPTIVGEIKRYFRDHSWSVRPPRGLQELHHSVRDCTRELEQQLRRAPSDEEVAERLNISTRLVDQAHVAARQYHAPSLDEPAEPGSARPLGETVSVDPADAYDSVLALVSLRGAMSQLSSRDQLVLRLRFEQELTQRQIGQRLGVSQMQVSRLLRGIIEQLRQLIDGPDAASPSRTERAPSAVPQTGT